jgi:hypothetical protein
MKLSDHLVAEQSHQVLEGLGDEVIGLLAAVERHLAIVAAPAISWEVQSVDTGLLRSLTGRRRDFLVVAHAGFGEYRVLIAARSYGTVLQASWLLVASPRLSNQLVRAMRFTADARDRHDIGAELDALALMDLNAFVGITRLALKNAIADLVGDEKHNEAAHTFPGAE